MVSASGPASNRRVREAMRAVHHEAVLHENPSPRAKTVARGVRLTAKPILAVTPISPRIFTRLQELEKRRELPYTSKVTVSPMRLNGVLAESQVPVAGTDGDLTILYFHGGGFFAGSIASHRPMTARLALAARAKVISVEYRQLPETDVAGSVEDAITAYQAVLDLVDDPTKIVVGGDSAGGYLATKVVELANRRGLTPPAGLIGFSPLLSVDPERSDKNVLQVSRVRDAYLPRRRVARIRRLWLPEGSVIEGFASPLHASAWITCPVHFCAVEDEFLRPEVEALAVLLTEKGIDVDLHLWRGLVHAFPVFVDVLPEALEEVEIAAAFARRVTGHDLEN